VYDWSNDLHLLGQLGRFIGVLQCQNSLQGLSIHNRVQLFWVPGHCAINTKTQIFGKSILGVSEYEEMSAGGFFVQFAEKSGRFETRVQ
jgi:hypothetical protein